MTSNSISVIANTILQSQYKRGLSLRHNFPLPRCTCLSWMTVLSAQENPTTRRKCQEYYSQQLSAKRKSSFSDSARGRLSTNHITLYGSIPIPTYDILFISYGLVNRIPIQLSTSESFFLSLFFLLISLLPFTIRLSSYPILHSILSISISSVPPDLPSQPQSLSNQPTKITDL